MTFTCLLLNAFPPQASIVSALQNASFSLTYQQGQGIKLESKFRSKFSVVMDNILEMQQTEFITYKHLNI